MLNTKRDKAINAAMTVLSLVIALAILFPIIWLVCSSFKQSNELFRYPLHMLSADPTAEHYVSVMEGGFMRYVGNSFFLAIVGTIITLVISSMCGYALAVYRNEIKYTNFVFGIFLLGTLIPGETLTVPQVSVISALGLYNNIWGVILPVVTTTTGIFLFRQMYMQLPLSFVEAARIDGCSEMQVLFRIVLPLSKAIVMTIGLYYGVAFWNDFFHAMLYLNNSYLNPLPILLRNILIGSGMNENLEVTAFANAPINAIKAASVFMSAIPMVIAYPFIQKYFTKGTLLGSVKG